MQVNERRPHLPRVSPTLLASSVILLSCLSLPIIRIQAFVPSSTKSSGSCGYSYSSSTSQYNTATSTRLWYAMPDVQSMKATEMKEELQSYGINTNTLFDKHDFEHALQEARRLYEQTLDDVMASTRPKEKTKKKTTTTTGFDAQSQQSQSQSSQRRKTVNYDRARHQDERIFTTDVNAHQNQHQHEPQFETAFGGNQQYQNYHQQQERQHQHQQQQQERPRQQRRQRHYQASPDQVGPNFHEYNTANNHNNANNNWDGRRRPQRPPRQAFEVDPMYAHEAQHHYGQQEQQQHRGGGGFYGDGYGHQQHHQEYHHEQRQYEDSYEVGGQQQHQHQQHQPRSYVDPEVNMKYQAALMEAYNMKVEDLQRELNTRGVSTKYCMVFKDFCHEYAEAVADNKQKKVVIKVTRSSDVDDNDDDDDDEDEEDDDDDEESSTFGDDEDYDPSYRDVVMQKYDPSMWI